MPTLGEILRVITHQPAGRGSTVVKDHDCSPICVPCTPLPAKLCEDLLCPQWACDSTDFCLTLLGWRDERDSSTNTYDITMPMTYYCSIERVTIFSGGIQRSDRNPFSPCLATCGMPDQLQVVIFCFSNTFDEPPVLDMYLFACGFVPPEFACAMHVRPLIRSCPNLSYGAWSNPDGIGDSCAYAFNSMALTVGHCAVSVVTHGTDCAEPIPPFEEIPPPPPSDWQHDCCPNRTQYAATIAATSVGGAAGAPFTPGCDECLTQSFEFQFLQNVGNGYPGYLGSLPIGSTCMVSPYDNYNVVLIRLYCPDKVNWACDAVFRSSALYPGVPDILVETTINVAPCTPGYPDNYADITLTANPGTNCAGGCPCYGGATVIMGG